jgi:hypothetical protein
MASTSNRGAAAVGVGDVNVDLTVRVHPEAVGCTLKFRGTTVHLTFAAADGEVSGIQVPGRSRTSVREIVEGG